MTVAISIQHLNSLDANFKEKLLGSLSLPMADDAAIDAAVVNILNQVKSDGDTAVLGFTKQFDRLNVNSVAELEIPKIDLEAAYLQLSSESTGLSRATEKRSGLPFLGIHRERRYSLRAKSDTSGSGGNLCAWW